MRVLARTLLVLAVALVGATGCGDGDSARDDSSSTDDAAEQSGDGGDDGLPELPIQIETPKTMASVHGSFELAGTAQVHEGELRWAILDAALEPMASGATTASCGAPCRGEFSTTIQVDDVPIGSWELHVWQPPVADEDPERVHDTILPITVTAQPVDADQPSADEPPPGGVPDQP